MGSSRLFFKATHKILAELILVFMCFYTFLMFSGYGLGWSRFPYDEWRVLLTCLLIFIPLVTLVFNTVPCYCNSVIVKTMPYLSLLYICILLYSSFVFKSLNSHSFLLLYALLFYCILIYGFALQFSYFSKFYLGIVTLLPTLTVVWLPVESILFSLFHNEMGSTAWLGNFINIRQYDDAILPILFILALLPLPKRYALMRWGVWAFILSASLHNGARAVCVSLITGLLFSVCWYRDWRWSKTILLSIAMASILAWLYAYLQNLPPLAQMQRYTSSGRSKIMLQAFHTWQENWILGSKTEINYFHVFHPHNIVLQWLAEYGLIGLGLVILCLWVFFQILKQSASLPPIAITGLVSIGVNSMLSGTSVYPHTQFLNGILIAYVISLLPLKPISEMGRIQFRYLNLLSLCLALFLAYLQYSNLTQWSTSSDVSQYDNIKSNLAPYWWQFGGVEKLRVIQN